ncbi:MAG: hypothetical protein EA381_14540 [Planctomycetaceae bacterium]|nr:MAG: hypothetical protein EA381_14540 [Planctomycetaceae bacterium]
MLNRMSVAVVVPVALLAIGGLTSGTEYARVFLNQGKQAVADRLPLQVEIDRLALVLEKFDDELGQARRVRAEAALRLEKAERQLQDRQASLAADRRKLESLRDRLQAEPAAECPTSRLSDDQRLTAVRGQLERFRTGQLSLERLEQTVEKLRTSQRDLDDQLEQRRQQRDLLASRLEAIRTEKTTLEWAAGGMGNLPSSDTLARAESLAERLEDVLRLERELAGPPTEPLDHLLGKTNDSQRLLSDLDEVLASESLATNR